MRRPATVVFVTQAPFVGGAERSLLRLAAGLDRRRYRPVVIAGHRGAVLQALRDAGVEAMHVPLPSPERTRPGPFLASVARLAAHLWRQRATLVHSNDAPAHPAVSLAARGLRVPRVCHLRFIYPAAGLRWWLRWGFERAIFASRAAQRAAEAECPELFAEARCSIIANGFDPPPAPDAASLGALRQACRLDPTHAVVGFIGRVIESKGIDAFLEAAAAVRAARSATSFLIVGDDDRPGASYRAAAERLAGRLGIGDACRFLGFRDDVWPLLHLCDVVVMPSRVEPFGNVAVEASAAGRALVATRVGGLAEIVRDGDTGLLVDVDDAAAIAAAVAALLADPARRAALGARARAHAAAHFGLAAHIDAVMQLYDALIEERRSP